MADELSAQDIVHQSALQLWAAAQTDLDGSRLVVGRDAGNLRVERIIPDAS